FDMFGNVSEWVADQNAWAKVYAGEHMDPKGLVDGYEADRGGSWKMGRNYLRAWMEFGESAGIRRDDLGFRCAWDGTAAPPPAPVSQPRAVRTNPKDHLEYVWIPPGIFEMGCPAKEKCYADEGPPHEVNIQRGFWLGRTEVTAAAFRAYLEEK